MSYHHENVTWQSPDGTWNRGFFAEDYLTCGGNEDECGDETHEWCREFDQSRFEWVSTGHPTEDAAWRSWTGSNPGSGEVVAYDPDSPQVREWVTEYEDLAAKKYEEATRKAAENSSSRTGLYGGSYRHPGDTSYWGYEGPARHRTLAALQRERNSLVEDWAGTYLAGYDNLRRSDDEARLDTQIAERLKTAAPQERAAYEQEAAAHRDRLHTLLDRARQRRLEDARRSRGYAYRPGSLDQAKRRADREQEIAGLIDTAEESAKTHATSRPARPPTTKTTTVEKADKAGRSKTKPSAPERAKTTAKSTPGSFAPKHQPQADASAFPGSAPNAGAWGTADADELPFSP